MKNPVVFFVDIAATVILFLPNIDKTRDFVSTVNEAILIDSDRSKKREFVIFD
jgi:hypothetical protein